MATEKYTRYEKARIIGARALQISMGAPVLVKTDNTLDPMLQALAELDSAMMPITVRRAMPSKKELG
jgi:DNA-directed RNA polymerase subunit K